MAITGFNNLIFETEPATVALDKCSEIKSAIFPYKML